MNSISSFEKQMVLFVIYVDQISDSYYLIMIVFIKSTDRNNMQNLKKIEPWEVS